jgi:hypothetical protein
MRRDEKDYGKLNPKAPGELARWAFLIGARSGEAKLKQDDGTWQTLRITWEGCYILDGYAIEDEYRMWTAAGELLVLGLNFRAYDAKNKTWNMKWLNGLNGSSEQPDKYTLARGHSRRTADGLGKGRKCADCRGVGERLSLCRPRCRRAEGIGFPRTAGVAGFSQRRDLQLLERCGTCAGDRPAHHAQRLSDAEPKWETVLDIRCAVQSGQAELGGQGLTCLEPENELCLVELSAGGEDASTLREFDLRRANL